MFPVAAVDHRIEADDRWQLALELDRRTGDLEGDHGAGIGVGMKDRGAKRPFAAIGAGGDGYHLLFSWRSIAVSSGEAARPIHGTATD
jgi:hypothetical protein